jgi:hypothetical protein
MSLTSIKYQKYRPTDDFDDFELETSYSISLTVLWLLHLVPDFVWRFAWNCALKAAGDPIDVTGLSIQETLRAVRQICSEVSQSRAPGIVESVAFQYESQIERIVLSIR